MKTDAYLKYKKALEYLADSFLLDLEEVIRAWETYSAAENELKDEIEVNDLAGETNRYISKVIALIEQTKWNRPIMIQPRKSEIYRFRLCQEPPPFEIFEDLPPLFLAEAKAIAYDQVQRFKDYLSPVLPSAKATEEGETESVLNAPLTKRDILTQAHRANGGRLTTAQVKEVAEKHNLSKSAMVNLYYQIREDLK